MGSMKILFIVVGISLAIALFWNSVPIIKETVHTILNPTAGKLLDWNPNVGIALFALVISLFIILIQKYTTDQDMLRQIKKEQKLLQEEMKKFKDNPEKIMELQKKQFQFIPRTFDLTLRPMMYTSVPIILFFRWFNDYFAANPIKIFGFLGWFWAYIIFSILFTSIFRKVFNVA
jgi:uncharacterized membrane protein (DUF106 family)